MSHSVVWADPAERDLGRIYEYLRVRSRAGTRTVIDGILSAVERLKEFPELGPRAEEIEAAGDLRHFPWRHYVIFYRVREEHVLIMRVWDSHRDPESLHIPDDPR